MLLGLLLGVLGSQSAAPLEGPSKEDQPRASAELLAHAAALDENAKLDVIVLVDEERADIRRLNNARLLPAGSPAEQALAREERRLARVELEQRAALRDRVLESEVEALGGSLRRSFWVLEAASLEVPAGRVEQLAALETVRWVALNEVAEPTRAQECEPLIALNVFPGSSAKGIQGGILGDGTFRFGGEDQISLAASHNAGYTGAVYDSTSLNPVFRVPLAIADSGFDLDTDGWRGGNPCWLPRLTGVVDPFCTNGLGVHGAFTWVERSLQGTCSVKNRVSYAVDVVPLVVPTIPDPWDSPEILYWGAPHWFPSIQAISGANFASYAHGTVSAALAGGTTYPDTGGSHVPNCPISCGGSGPGGGPYCPVLGMTGVAPEADLMLLKVGLDQLGSGAPLDAQILSLELAAAAGAWIINTSYEGGWPHPLKNLLAIAIDRAATDLDLVIVRSAGNAGGDYYVDQINPGSFNQLFVGSVGTCDPLEDVVSPGSSHGPVAWWENDPDVQAMVVSQRQGINLVAPGGHWPGLNSLGEPTPDAFSTMTLPFPESTFSFGAPGSSVYVVWSGWVGTSFAAPQVAGAAAQVFGARVDPNLPIKSLKGLEVRAILMNEADDISQVPENVARGEDGNGFGEGRLNCLASSHFFDWGGKTYTGSVVPGDSRRDFQQSFQAGDAVEITLTWDRVTFPIVRNDTRVTNLTLAVFRPTTGGPLGIPIATSARPEDNFERLTFTAPNSGMYTIRVSAGANDFVLDDNLTTPPVPFAVACAAR